jgi:hypothetical protein
MAKVILTGYSNTLILSSFTMKFNPHLFANVRARRDTPAQRRRYQAMWQLLSGDELKRAREWDLFVRFCEVGKLGINPAKIEMLDPPWPDLKTELPGHTHYFELSEIVQQGWLEASEQQKRKTVINSPLPLAAVYNPLELIIKKKTSKLYMPQATPLSLLLYWERNAPSWAIIEPVINDRTCEIRALLDNSVFDKFWLFMVDENHIPFSLSKKMIV